MGAIWRIRKLYQDIKYSKLILGKNSRINLGVIINNPKNMIIGNNTYINGGMFSIGQNSKIIIGDDCLISYAVHFRTTTHNFLSKDILIREQGEYEKDIVVEDDVWIGYGAQILPGITLHKGCVVGAGAVVTHDVMAYSVVAGVPARVIKMRL